MNQTIDAAGLESPALQLASSYYSTGLIWHNYQTFDLASTCFERALDAVSMVDLSIVSNEVLRNLLIDLNIATSRTAWEVSDRDLALALLNQTRILLSGLPEHFRVLGNQYYAFGKILLDSSSFSGAIKLLNEALDLYEKGLSLTTELDGDFGLKNLKFKSLRLIMVAHLRLKEFESATKCMKVVRQCGHRHPSLTILATKALAGLGRYGEAEKELWVMVAENSAPESMWVSAVETYIEAAGEAGAETAREVFLGWLERRRINAGAAVRVVRSVLGDRNKLSEARAKAAAELVSDGRVVALFDGAVVEKERNTMHALLWNSASSHYQAYNYWISARLYEKSMLYSAYEMEELSFQFLCLSYLGLDMLDKAEECIRRVEKFGPSVACTYLKLRICLQKFDYAGAINQIQTSINCPNFTPSCLFDLAREAFAWDARPVVVVSLLKILEFYKSGERVSTAESVVMRALTSILMEESGIESDVLEFLQLTYVRPSETGKNSFEEKWFAATSWNYWEKMAERKYDLSVDFLIMASRFYGGLDDELEDENKIMVFKSLISSCNPKHLLRFSLHALRLPSFNYEAVSFALKECLSALLSSPLPDYKDVSLVIRKLITVTSTYEGEIGDEVYRLYKKAHETMVGLKEGEYPCEEMTWLAATALKCHISARRMELIDLAKKWMDVSLDIANQC